MTRLTITAINKEIARIGIKAELVKGDGYFYFVGDDVDVRKSTSVMVYRLNELTFAEWIEEAKSQKEGK